MRKPNLGKLLSVGDTFKTTTKKMDKKRCRYTALNKENNGPLITYEVLRGGDKRFFTKGKRQYYCVVLGIVEIRTGVHVWDAYSYPDGSVKFKPYNRWWQFTYLVKILEN